MLNRFRPRLSYANVLSTLALFVALGGGAYAAIQLPANSVGSRQLKKNAVRSSKVKDHTLQRKDVKRGAFATPRQLIGLDAAKLGGIGPGGFVHGAGRVISADFKGTTRTLSPFFTFPGGLQFSLGCTASGYTFRLDNSDIGNQSFDVFSASLLNASSPMVRYQTITRETLSADSTGTATEVVDEDVSSPAGRAGVRVWLNFDTASKTCDVRARGLASP